MNPETFSDWLRGQGHTVVRSDSSFWYDAGPHVFQAFPYHWVIQPPADEIRKLMLSNRVLALRYSAPINSKQGMASYHVILRGSYELGDLRHQARNSIKRGLKNSKIELISFERLADEGWKLQHDTMERQDRTNSMTQSEWQRICLSAKGIPGFEAWAATVSDEMAASLLITRVDDTYYIPYALSQTKHLNLYVNNALFYVVNRELLSRAGVKQIFYNLHSLDAPESVDEFKFRMNFTPIPIRQRVVFHPWLTPFANISSHKILTALLHLRPNSSFLTKTEGMLRFHLKGKMPIEKQEWPVCVSHQKDELMASYR